MKFLVINIDVPKTTPYVGMLNETGIWNVHHQLIYKRLMLYHNIMNAKGERFVRKLIIEEEKDPFQGCWVEKVAEDAEQLGLKLEKLRKELKSKAKKEIKKAIERSMNEYIQQQVTTKLRTVCKSGFYMKQYLQGVFSGKEVSDIMKAKLHMLEFRANYRKLDAPTECRLCGKEEETTEHIFIRCSMLEEMREGMRISQDMLESEEKVECSNIVKIKKVCDLLPLNLPQIRKEAD